MAGAKSLILCLALLGCSQLGAATFGNYVNDWHDSHGKPEPEQQTAEVPAPREAAAQAQPSGGLLHHDGLQVRQDDRAYGAGGLGGLASDLLDPFNLHDHKKKKQPPVEVSGPRQAGTQAGPGAGAALGGLGDLASNLLDPLHLRDHKEKKQPPVEVSGPRQEASSQAAPGGLGSNLLPAVQPGAGAGGLGAGLLDPLHLHKKKQQPAVEVSGPRQQAAPGHLGKHFGKHRKVAVSGPAATSADGASGGATPSINPVQCSTVADLIKAPEFSTLAAAVDAAGLGSYIADPNLAATVFAPTNDAFTKTLSDLNIKPENLLANKELLTAILQYHVLPGQALEAGELRDSRSYDTLLKQDNVVQRVLAAVSTVTKLNAPQRTSEEVYSIVPSGGPSAQIVAKDINAGCNAVVQGIDYVLLPQLDGSSKQPQPAVALPTPADVPAGGDPAEAADATAAQQGTQ